MWNIGFWGVIVDEEGREIEGGIWEAVGRNLITEGHMGFCWGLFENASGEGDKERSEMQGGSLLSTLWLIPLLVASLLARHCRERFRQVWDLRGAGSSRRENS